MPALISLLLLALLLPLLLTFGCGAAPRYGSFLAGTGADDRGLQQALAEDAAAMLLHEAPETGTFVVRQQATDPFGTALCDELRSAGHAVRRQRRIPDAGGAAPGAAVVIRYVVDQLKGTELLRVIVEVDGATRSRAYARRGEVLRPAGPWVRGERR